jgi:hypothetical protein
LKTKYKGALDLYVDMLNPLPQRRPNCEEILNRKNSWTLNEDEFEIDEKVKKELNLKMDDENQLIFSKLKSKLNI